MRMEYTNEADEGREKQGLEDMRARFLILQFSRRSCWYEALDACMHFVFNQNSWAIDGWLFLLLDYL